MPIPKTNGEKLNLQTLTLQTITYLSNKWRPFLAEAKLLF